jgi:membrane protein
MRIRRRSSAADLLVRTIAGFFDHRSGRSAALVSHFGFISVFPLLVVFTTILGYALQDDPDLQQRILDSAFSQIPIVGPQLASDPSALRGSAVVLIAGILASLWSGLRAFVALQTSLDDIREIPRDRRSNPAVIRLHALIGIGIVGSAQIATATLSSLVAVAGIAGISKVLFVVGSVVINSAVLAQTYRWLCSRRQTWRSVLPGALAAGFVFAALQLVGAALVGRAIARASAVYGAFASVIGLLTWLSLHAIVALLGAELNMALDGRRVSLAAASSDR